MRHEILEKPDFSMVKVHFDQPGESVLVEASSMVAKDSAIEMKTSMQGGMMSALKRAALGGESLFQNTYTATAAGQTIFLAPAYEGDVEVVDVAQYGEVMLSSGAFLASTPTVTIDTKWGGAKGFFSGAGLFLLKATGTGPLFFSCYGGIHPVDVGPNGYICDTSMVVGFTRGLDFNVTKLGGLKSLFLSGEGLVCHFRGQGKLWISTRNPASLAAFMHPFRPVKQQNHG